MVQIRQLRVFLPFLDKDAGLYGHLDKARGEKKKRRNYKCRLCRGQECQSIPWISIELMCCGAQPQRKQVDGLLFINIYSAGREAKKRLRSP